MKLKYLIEMDDKYLFANCLDDLASYFKLTLVGLRYRLKNNLLDFRKIDIKLQNVIYDYTIDKNGVVIVLKKDFINSFNEKDNNNNNNVESNIKPMI